MREVVVEEQIQWILSYVQEGSVDIWKENILKDLEMEVLEYKMAEKFLTDLRKEFGRGEEETVKVVELRRSEQEKKQ